MTWDLWAFDTLILIMVGLFFYRGYKSGLVNQIVWLLSIVPAYLIGIRFCFTLYSLFGWELYDKNITVGIWFIIAFALVMIGMHYAGRAVTNLLNLSVVGVANSILGGCLNLAITVVVIVAVVNLGSILAPGPIREMEETVSVGVALRLEEWFMDSHLLGMLESGVDHLPDIMSIE